jgi:DNA-binding NtrC family response regulator
MAGPMIQANTARVLVIDDEAIVCRSCIRILAVDGHEVCMAQTGEEALRLIEQRSFDVVLLDLRIPGSGGLRLLRAIRSATPETQVVVITGYPSIDYAKEAIRLGALEFMAKPFTSETLRELVWRALACKPMKILER